VFSFRRSFPRWRIRLKNCRLQYGISCSHWSDLTI
jgi:hypothetical protein